MSDLILRIFPKQEVLVDKTPTITDVFQQKNIIGEETVHWGKPAYKSGLKLRDFLHLEFKNTGKYIANLVLQIEENSYGIVMKTEDYDTVKRKNVILIYQGDGSIIGWSAMCEYLKLMTGDEYVGKWEIL